MRRRLREALRPYYLRWIYFRLSPGQRPSGFSDCWQYPFRKLDESARLPAPSNSLPDLIFYPMNDWHTRMQRTQHLARALRDLGYRAIYLNPHLGREFESIRLFDKQHRLAEIEEGIYELHVRLPREPVFHHRLLSGEEDEVIASALRQALPQSGHAVQLLSFPIWFGVARRFRKQAGFPLVYDCHDLLGGFQNISPDLVAAEADLLQEADLVLFSAQGLVNRYGNGRKWLLARNAVNAADFRPPATRPAGPPVAGYVGALDSWFDTEALERSAASNPRCRFVLAGRVDHAPIRRLKALPNVELIGEVPYDRVPELLAQFHVALIPFRMNSLTLMTNPIKLYEYFACGLPVVTTPIPEAQTMGDLVYLGATPADFARQVSRAVEEDDSRRRARRREIAMRESWCARARDIAAELAGLPYPAPPVPSK